MILQSILQNAFRWVWLGSLVATAALSARAQDSVINTSPLRLRIEPLSNSAWPATVGTFEISPCLASAGRFGVFTAAGKPVAFQTLWSAGGDVTYIRFDISTLAKTYYICFDTNLPPAPGSWKPQAGVLLETRPCAEQSVRTMAEFTQLLNSAGPVQGRGYVPEIFLGINPFGPGTFYTATFTGWFVAPGAGSFGFATVSSGPSSLMVDGQLVTEWLGRHPPNGGRRGQHSGEIRLGAGLHRLEYTGIQFDGEAAAEAAWKPPGADHYVLMSANAFLPVARFRATSFETTTTPETLYFEAHTMEHCALDESVVPRVRFRVVDNYQRREYLWRFDDGGAAAGLNTSHFFPQPGLRNVTLEAWAGGQLVATNAVRLRVAPDWMQRDWWRDDIFNDAKNDFLHRDLAKMPPRDIAAIITLADRADDRELLTYAGKMMVQRAPEFTTAADGIEFYKLGIGFQHQGDDGDALAEKSFRLALAPERNLGAVADKVKLRLADFLMDCPGDLAGAESLLGEVRPGSLTGDEKRLQKLLAGDLLLARGKIEEARQQFLSIGSRQNGANSETTRAARLEGANIFIEHDQFDEARQALDWLTFEFPLERMSVGTSLLAIELALKQKEFRRAFTGCQRLLPVAENDPQQSRVLFATVESGLASGKIEEARRALARLLKEFPYSESAAKAKDRWPSK